jgi:hypothetical protein
MVRAAIPWAPASIQMMDKLLNRSFVQQRDCSTFPLKPMNQVFGRSNVPPGRYLCVARLAQLLSKPFKQAAIWAVA